MGLTACPFCINEAFSAWLYDGFAINKARGFFFALKGSIFFRGRRRISEECGKIVETAMEKKNYVNFELMEGNGQNEIRRNTKTWIFPLKYLKIKDIRMWKTVWKMWITYCRRKLHILLCKVNIERSGWNKWNKQENNFRFCQKNRKKNRHFFIWRHASDGNQEKLSGGNCRRLCKYTERNIQV